MAELESGMSGDPIVSDCAYLAAIVESARDAIVGINLENRIISWNRGAETIYGYSSAEAVGKSFVELVCGKTSKLPLSETSTPIIDKHRCRDGREIEIGFTISPIAEATGRVIGKSIVAKPIASPNPVSLQPSEWTSLVSHELRTPLTSIRGSLGLLLTGKLGTLSPQGQRMLEIAVKNTERLLRLLNDLLDLQRLQAKDWLIRKSTCNIADLMQEAAEGVYSLADKNKIDILVSKNPIYVEVDRDRVVQLLINLLGNAIKFSPPNSEISLSATLEARQERVSIAVKDRGRGIPLDKQQLIFESFEQVDPTDAREKQGTGLGLAICRSIVRQHQGDIWVESKLGEGSTFYVSLPVT